MTTDPAATPIVAELYLLGPPRLVVDGEVVHLDTRKAMAILARLAVDGRQRRDALVDWLWPTSDPIRARSSLRRTLSTLRTAVPPPAVDETTDTIDLVRRHLRCDLDPTTSMDLAHRVAAYHDEFLEGFRLATPRRSIPGSRVCGTVAAATTCACSASWPPRRPQPENSTTR